MWFTLSIVKIKQTWKWEFFLMQIVAKSMQLPIIRINQIDVIVTNLKKKRKKGKKRMKFRNGKKLMKNGRTTYLKVYANIAAELNNRAFDIAKSQYRRQSAQTDHDIPLATHRILLRAFVDRHHRCRIEFIKTRWWWRRWWWTMKRVTEPRYDTCTE